MANKKISDLPPIPILEGTDVLPIVDDTDSTTKKVSIDQLAAQFVSDPYTAIVSGFSAAYGIPANGDALQSILEKLAGNTLSAPLTVELSTSTAVTSSFVDTPGCNMTQIGNLNITFTAFAGEYVDFSFDGAVVIGAGAGLIYGYQIDSNTPFAVCYLSFSGNTSASITTVRAGPFSAAAHSIKIVASTAGSTSFAQTNYQRNVLKVLRNVG